MSMTTITNIIRYECLQAWRTSAELLNPILFFVIVCSLFPLAIGAQPTLLQATAPGIIWVAALLATLLTCERLFSQEWQQGCLPHWLLSPHSLPLIIFAKIIAQWLLTGLPLILTTPLLALLFNLSGYTTTILLATLVLGTPILNLIGSIAAALLIGVRGSGILLPLLLLPLYIPVLVFAVLATTAAANGGNVSAPLAMLAAILALSISLAPLASASALKIGAE